MKGEGGKKERRKKKERKRKRIKLWEANVTSTLPFSFVEDSIST